MHRMFKTARLSLVAGIGAALVAAAPALADAGHSRDAAIGKPSTAAAATRTVEVTMGDNFFEPETIWVQPGETVRFVIRNKGELLHEFNIGTAQMHATHQKEMAQMMEHGMLTPTGVNREMLHMDHAKETGANMKHDDPNSVLVEPGKTVELVWTFPNSHELEFACNIPGHYEAGMVGRIRNMLAN